MNVQDLVRKIQHLEFSTNRKVNDIFVGNYKSAFRGKGMEFADIRAYDEGDDFRDIDWITTAKQQKLFVKTYHESRELTTLLLIDVSGSMHVSSTQRTKKEIALELIATLCFSSLKNNDRVGAVFFTDKVLEFVYPRKGWAHVWKILRSTILHFEQNMYSSSDITVPLHFVTKAFPRRALAFIVSDECDGENQSVKKAFSTLSHVHDCVFARVFDPLEKGVHVHGVFRFQDPETGDVGYVDLTNPHKKKQFAALREKKELSMKRMLQSTAVDMVEIGPKDSLYKQLFVFFKLRQQRY